ncbi:uncharacterized protein LOC110952251 [Acanthochromis polyacanthus]|uniref:uncharacterized protein LOC110952251 n=1 Tax=Acanthochromis polyacanthus TaxID=80966 RepID=UPI000B8F2282|nr:uncharacterized protein LOC110952251 [Acanthochromis polyacanthus]XP_051798131.1 uncharacterized protein LOC110952251 [Acanthochromis polyacanthus]
MLWMYRVALNAQEEQRRTDVDVPLLTPDIFNTVVSMFLNDVASEQWRQLQAGHMDLDTFTLLSDMCKETVDAVSVSVLEAVEPQVTNGGTIIYVTTGTETQPKRQHHIYRVTEEAIRCLGDSLHRCFGEALGLERERTHELEELVELFGLEVMNKVNRKLAQMEAATSAHQTKTSEASSHIEDMVRLVADILKRCKNTFLAGFLWRLLHHINTETRTPIKVDFYEKLERLIEQTEGELTSTFPQTTSNLNVCIYKQLCQEFRCAAALMSAVAYNPVAFEEAVARALKAKKKNVSCVKKVKRFFGKKTSKVTPG